jgi:Transmembrane secretion effector
MTAGDPPWEPPGQDAARRGRLRQLTADIAPLRTSRDFRLLFASRTVTLFGSQATEVALLVQAKQLTGSAVAVGLLGAVEMVPLVVFGLYGGALADRLDRRRLIRWCEAGLGCCAALLVANASLPRPTVWPLYLIAAGLMALSALQRPSLDASVPRVIGRACRSFRVRRPRDSAAAEPSHRDRLQPERAGELGYHRLAVDRAAAEQVDRDQVLFRPGVNAQVRLREDEHQRDRAVREDHVAGVQDVAPALRHRRRRQRRQPRDVGDR